MYSSFAFDKMSTSNWRCAALWFAKVAQSNCYLFQTTQQMHQWRSSKSGHRLWRRCAWYQCNGWPSSKSCRTSNPKEVGAALPINESITSKCTSVLLICKYNFREPVPHCSPLYVNMSYHNFQKRANLNTWEREREREREREETERRRNREGEHRWKEREEEREWIWMRKLIFRKHTNKFWSKELIRTLNFCNSKAMDYGGHFKHWGFTGVCTKAWFAFNFL